MCTEYQEYDHDVSENAAQNFAQSFSKKRRCNLLDLYSRNIEPFAAPNCCATDQHFKKYWEKSHRLTRNQRERSLLNKETNVVIPLGRQNNCIVFRVHKYDKDAFKMLRTHGFKCSKDTYTVEAFSFFDYYYRISHLPFAIPTCQEFSGQSIHLLAENSFVLAAGSPDTTDYFCEYDDTINREYELFNDKEIMVLPTILENAIREKFNL